MNEQISTTEEQDTIWKAVFLLDDQNLVWSQDFEAIRGLLASWLTVEATVNNTNRYSFRAALDIASRLVADA